MEPSQDNSTDTYKVLVAAPSELGAEVQVLRTFFEQYSYFTAQPTWGIEFRVLDAADVGAARSEPTPPRLVSPETFQELGESLVLLIVLLGEQFDRPSATQHDMWLAYDQSQEPDPPEVKWFFRTSTTFGGPTEQAESEAPPEALDEVAGFRERVKASDPSGLHWKDFADPEHFGAVLREALPPWLADTQRPWHGRTPPPGVQQPEREGDPAEETVALDEIKNIEHSPTIADILRRAEHIASDDRGQGLIDSSHLLFAMLRCGQEYQNRGIENATAFLFDLLARPDWARYTECVGNYLSSPKAGRPKRKAMPAPMVTATVKSLFDHARDIARRTGRSGHIRGRHLAAALLTYPADRTRPGALDRLDELRVNVDALRQEFREVLLRGSRAHERYAWRNVLGGPRPDKISRFNADRPDGEDCLGVMRDVHAMAALMSAKSLQPPLSIGLFGSWGSGKSFFMDKLDGAVNDKCEDRSYRDKCWSNVVQIKFNAWHYVDANLWASLVCHIFEELDQWGKDRPSPAEQARQAAMKDLRVATEARAAAESEACRAVRTWEEARELYDRRLADYEKDQGELARAVAMDVWDRVKDELGAESEEYKGDLEKIGLHVEEVKASVEQVHTTLTELDTLGGWARSVGASMLKWRGAWLALTVFGVVVVGGLAAAYFWESMRPLLGVIGQVTGVIAGAATWVATNATKVSKALKPLGELRTRVDASLKKSQQEKAGKIAALEKQLDHLEAACAEAVKSMDEAERECQAAEMRLEDARSGRLITRFIEERAASSDYRKHLGIVAMIHHDFKKLSDMINDHNEQLLAKEHSAPQGAAKPAPKSGRKRQTKDLGINRIILYVDDLDRCPPERVVEVLQAIHLLLAFPLFVVVVGVDARWLSSSLQDQFAEMLVPPSARRNDGRPNEEAWHRPQAVASPDDYLGKIFQVPYWLKRMEHSHYKRLIDVLVDQDLAAPRSPGEPPTTPTGGVEASATGTSPDAPGDQTPSPTTPGPGDTPPESPDKPPSRDGDSEVTGPEDKRIDADGETEIGPEGLQLENCEADAMKQLAAIVGRSPRVTKRFVNTYRLIKASLTPVEFARFVGDEETEGTFRLPMLLLAIVHGTPDLAPHVFSAIRGAAADQPEADRTFKSLANAVIGKVTDADARGRVTDQAVREAGRVRLFLESDDSGPWGSIPVTDLRQRLERVRQFTFNVSGDLTRQESVPESA